MQTTRGASLSDATNSADGDTGPATVGRHRRIGVLVAVAAGVLTLDVISKVVVVARLSGSEPVRLLGGLLTLRVTRNSGAAFSIGTGVTFVFTLIALGVVVAIVRTARRLYSLPWAITLGLLLGGATGNLVDRLLRSPGPLKGHVVDWIELPHWPVFNLADSAIVCGGALAVLLAAKGILIDGTHATGDEPAPEPAAQGPEHPATAGDRPAGDMAAGDAGAGDRAATPPDGRS